MNKYVKTTLLVLLILGGIAGALYWFVLRAVDVDMEPSVNNYVIEFNELNEKVYISARAWGLTGDHEEIILSTSPISNEHRSYSKDEYFIFYTSEVYYKKEGVDTLLVYAGASTISAPPKGLSTSIKIIQKELKDYDEVRDYKMNYKKYDLSKVSVYKDK